MVPSESELVDRYGVSGGTIRKAMVEVRASGLVETRHGKGSIVKNRPPVRHRSSNRFRRSLRQGGQAAYLAESVQSGATAKVSVLYIGPMDAPEDAAERLGVPAGTQVLARRRLYFRNGTPVETASSYLPWDVVKEIPELFAENPGAVASMPDSKTTGMSSQSSSRRCKRARPRSRRRRNWRSALAPPWFT
ncbi:hypothetical protein Sfulv_31040 [Streptomyces fulvorobeus]|uniref:HTH gntR-type domain-containing protein n=1 Tax=Streptomyces fulvorobeus TaxID=284028 RepID=A0A7J0C8L9_9ACTN|nr:hypothetical protein Sfulv_31040 [Streptomyces fulvorobeus]